MNSTDITALVGYAVGCFALGFASGLTFAYVRRLLEEVAGAGGGH